MDKADACTPADVTHILDLPQLLRGKAFHIQASNAITGGFQKAIFPNFRSNLKSILGEGVQDGLTWLAQKLKERKMTK